MKKHNEALLATVLRLLLPTDLAEISQLDPLCLQLPEVLHRGWTLCMRWHPLNQHNKIKAEEVKTRSVSQKNQMLSKLTFVDLLCIDRSFDLWKAPLKVWCVSRVTGGRHNGCLRLFRLARWVCLSLAQVLLINVHKRLGWRSADGEDFSKVSSVDRCA